MHVPFCRTKCVYCDFTSTVKTDLIGGWLESLEREIGFYKKSFTHFDTLYLGGGTPTLLEARELELLFAVLRNHFTFAPDSEITIEANPDDIRPDKLVFLKSLGINRISFGVQSFSDRDLLFLRRRHDADAARRAIKQAMDAGFTNISIDLMYGLPGQTKGSWLRTLEEAISFQPAHLSCYQLTVEGPTSLRDMITRGEVRMPGEKQQEAFFLLTSKVLDRHGFIHYEVSNFAGREEFACRHNQKYWQHTPYLGLGPAAHSFDGARRWWNCKSVGRYCDIAADQRRPVEEEEGLSEEQLQLERLFLGLRTLRGIDARDIPASALPAVAQLRKSRILKAEGDRLYPTRRGYLVADSLPVLLSV